MNAMHQQNNWKRRTVLFFVSQCVTLFGSQVVQMAVIWYVTLQTGSGAWIAAFSVCSYLPQVFVSFLGGVWADRYDRKHLIIAADLWIALVTGGMLLLMPRITETSVLLAALLLMAMIRSAGAGIQNPAVNATIAQLVPEAALQRCNGIFATMQSVVQFAAPAVAALILSGSSLRAAMLIDILTAGVGIGLLACIHLPKAQCQQEKNSMLADMAIGVRYAYEAASMRKTLVVYGLFLFLTVPAGYLSGLLVSRMYGDTYWYLTAVELVGFGGMMIGGLLMSIWKGFAYRRHTLAAGLFVFGAMAIAMGLGHCFPAYLVYMAIYGIALTAVQTTITTMIQEYAKPSMHGRMFGLMSSLYAGCYPLGMALFGPMADWIPLQGIMVFSGIALMAIAADAYGDRKLHTNA